MTIHSSILEVVQENNFDKDNGVIPFTNSIR